MYYPGKYDEHNNAQKRLIKLFNDIAKKKGSLVEMYFQEHENFRDDGGLINNSTGEKILYDFEKRHTYYNRYGEFQFSELGQFERKIQKDEIKLSIQVSTDESALVLAWHEDYKKEDIVYLKSKTQDGKGESNGKRFTSDFIEINYEEMEKFYDMVVKAFTERKFNKESFGSLSYGKKTSKVCEYDNCNVILTNAVYNYSIKNYGGKAYCYNCQRKM